MTLVYRVFVAALLLAFLAPAGQAGTYGFAWDYPATCTPAQNCDADGFKLWCGTATGVYDTTTPKATVTPKTARTVTNVGPFDVGVNYFCALTAFKAGLPDSGYSNEINFPGRLDKPLNLKLVQTYTWDEPSQRWMITMSFIEEMP